MNKKAGESKASKSTTKLTNVVKNLKEYSANKLLQTLPKLTSLRTKFVDRVKHLDAQAKVLQRFFSMVSCKNAFEVCILMANMNNLILTSKIKRFKILCAPPVELTKKFLAVLSVYYPNQRVDHPNIGQILILKFQSL